MAKLTLKTIKKELEKLEKLEEKKEYLEKTLRDIKDNKLKKEVEKLLKEIKELLEAKEETKPGLEKKFTTKIPAPELPEAPKGSKIEEMISPKPTAAPAAPPPSREKKELTLLEKYLKSAPTPAERRLAEPVTPTDIYRMRLTYMSEPSRETVQNVITKYLRAEGINPEELAASPQLQHRAAEKARELLGGRIEMYEIERQVQYETQKLAHPELEWQRSSEGIMQYKLKVIKPDEV